jgi:thermitase
MRSGTARQHLRLSLKILTAAALASIGAATALGFAPPYGLVPLLPKELPKVTLRNWGLANNTARSHISAVDAWKLEEGNRQIVVAVIDTGIDPKHPDLVQNLWRDPSSLKLKEPIFGWDFVRNKPNPTDEHRHGTHVAGIIGATFNAKAGVSGVAHRVSIMPVRYYSEANDGKVNLANTIKALNYAIDHGARIINYSGGGPEFANDEYQAIKRAEAKGILLVAAAGNDHQNTDLVQNSYYPAAYHLSNIITVAATDIHNNLLPSSNWGRKGVDVAAPGENIFSTIPGGRFD